MVKLLGSLCIFFGSGLVWWNQYAARRRRRDTLWDLLRALRRMREEIRMARTPLPLLLEAVAVDCRNETAMLFHQAAEAARQGEDLSMVWRQGVETLPLTQREQELLSGLTLRGDEENVCKGISLVTSLLEKSEEEARKTGAEEVKRTTALCFSGAALLVILLI